MATIITVHQLTRGGILLTDYEHCQNVILCHCFCVSLYNHFQALILHINFINYLLAMQKNIQ